MATPYTFSKGGRVDLLAIAQMDSVVAIAAPTLATWFRPHPCEPVGVRS